MPEVTPSKYVLYAGWDDVPHLDEQTKADLLASYPPHEREARARGEPALGSGAIYPVAESEIICDPFAIPPYWPRCFGLDVGWKRTAAVWLAHDRAVDVVYAYTEHYRGEAEPSVHASAIKARGEWVPGVIDPAARGRQQADGKQLFAMYVGLGLDLTLANNEVEAGIYSVWERLSTGRLKIFSTLQNLRAEYRQYHRDEKGKVVKEHDHCLHPETRVLTRDGAVPIRGLVGTEGEVLSIDGEWQPYRSCRMTARNQEVVEVVFEDGASVTCTPDHKFYTQNGWVEAQDLAGRDCYNAVSQRIRYGEPCKSTSPAAARSPSTNTPSPARAAESALVRCKAVRSAGRSDVYCLTVPTTAAFAVESGVIVHNCMDALRYGIMTGLKVAQVEPAKTTSSAAVLGDAIAGY